MLFVFWGFCLHLSKPFMLKVENVKTLLEVETRVLLQQQKVLCEGREMRNSEMLSALGVKDEDWIMIVSNVTLRSVDCGSLVGRVPKLILQIKGFTDATNRKRICGCNAFDACNKQEATTLMELLWHVSSNCISFFIFLFTEFIILLSW
nr:uncharacterized protein LOC108171182 isoform X3 [Malus domestica]